MANSFSVSGQSGARKRHGSSVQGVACRVQCAGLGLYGTVQFIVFEEQCAGSSIKCVNNKYMY